MGTDVIAMLFSQRIGSKVDYAKTEGDFRDLEQKLLRNEDQANYKECVGTSALWNGSRKRSTVRPR
jgi:hypothetical protein